MKGVSKKGKETWKLLVGGTRGGREMRWRDDFGRCRREQLEGKG